ncbi:hypothetical protein DYB30_000429 [Aphanomyces astaci]|uniref:Bromo domain-containing protein n=1 Tax=Aphanomyces astaci TaxID=112090 RepID=A0A397DJ19_APHAT|nr:hypothetical protein DYB30_000429 [Aphanomyces astaci]
MLVWNTSVNLLAHNQWGDPDPQIVAKLKWSQTNAGKVPPPGVLYTDWIACLTAAWTPYPPTGCDDPTAPPGQYIADAMFSPRRHFAAATFNLALYVFGGRARELVPMPHEDTIGGLDGAPRGDRWMEYAVLKNDVWKSQDAGVSWALVTPGCDLPNALETYHSGSKPAQCTTQNDCHGDTTCVFDKTTLTGTCMCNMWSARELHTVVVFQKSLFLAGGYTAVQRNLCGPEHNQRPSGQEFACGGLYRKFMHDVWTSNDGHTWTQLTAAAAWPPRGEHAMTTWQGQLWLVGGRTSPSTVPGSDEDSQQLLNDIWTSANGITWTLADSAAPWSPRGKHAALGVEADPATNTSAYMIVLYGENDDTFLGDVWTMQAAIDGAALPMVWVPDFDPVLSLVRQYVTPTRIHTITDLTNVPLDIVINLRTTQDVPVCDYIAVAKLVVAQCTIAPVDYDGKEFENVKVLKGKNAEVVAALDAASASAVASSAWDGCAHRGTATLDWVTLKYVWPEVGGIPQVDTKDPFPNVQNSACKWTPKARSSFAAIQHNHLVYVFGGKVDNRVFDNSAWYRDPTIPKAKLTSVPESYSHTTTFTFESAKAGTIFQYHVIDMVEQLVVRNWTNCLHQVDFVDWLDGGLHRFRLRAIDPAGNVESTFDDGRNEYVWVYVPRPPWNLIIAMLVLFFVMCLGVFLEWRRRRKQAAMERYAMKRMRRKMRGKKKGNKDADWRETYDDAKDGKKAKKKGGGKSKVKKDKGETSKGQKIAPAKDLDKKDKPKKDKNDKKSSKKKDKDEKKTEKKNKKDKKEGKKDKAKDAKPKKDKKKDDVKAEKKKDKKPSEEKNAKKKEKKNAARKGPKKEQYMESVVAVEPGIGGTAVVVVHDDDGVANPPLDVDTEQRPTPSPSQSRSQSQSPANKGTTHSDPTSQPASTLTAPTSLSTGVKAVLGGIPLELSATQSISRRLVPTDVTMQCPLLLGSYCVDENGVALWTGRWAMTEAEYATGITSLFEMKSKPLPMQQLFPNQSGSTHNNNGLHAENATDEDENRASPLASDKSTTKGSCPIERKFDGFFQILTMKGKPATIPEKDVSLTFQKCDMDNVYLVRGTGENRFGVFTLQGLLDETSQELRLYKAYKPKDKTPVAKRTRPKAEPVVKVEAQTAHVEKTPSKKQKVKVEPAYPIPQSITSSLATSVAVDFAYVSKALGAAPTTTSAPTISYERMSNAARHRSERKRSLPAHLREEGLAELERVPAMRKCHNILKNLITNPKSVPFLVPVDPVALAIPDYFKVIKEPMDLGTVRGNLENGVYPDPHAFAEQVRLVFNNCMRYNAAHTQVHVFAQKLLEEFEKKMKAVFKTEAAMKLGKGRGNNSDGEGSQDSYSTTSQKKKSKSKRPKDEEILVLKEEIEKMKVLVHGMYKGTPPGGTPGGSKPRPARPFRMQDLTEEQLLKPMTANEKHKLTSELKTLPEEKISRLLQLIAEIVPFHTIANGDDEVELDLNLFDTRSLRMMEGYLREHNVAKRKRPPKKAAAKESDRLQMAKESTEAIKFRQEELQRKLAAIESGTSVANISRMIPQTVEDLRTKIDGDKSSDSSSSDSGSSDSESSDSDTEQPLQKVVIYETPLSVLPVVEDQGAAAAALVPLSTSEPLKVENRGAWTKLAGRLESMDMPSVGDNSASSSPPTVIQSDENASTSLWLYARTMEQQKLQKEQMKDVAAPVLLPPVAGTEDVQAKDKERDRRLEELKLMEETTERKAREARQRDLERSVAAMRKQEREKLKREVERLGGGRPEDSTLFRTDLAQFGSASFY